MTSTALSPGSSLLPAQPDRGTTCGPRRAVQLPLTIGELRIDVAIAFGVNDEFDGRMRGVWLPRSSRPNARSAPARHGPNVLRQKDDLLRQLSFHSQLEDALTGDIWVAFQPQYALATGQPVGVDALALTHSTRGPIPTRRVHRPGGKSQDIYRLTLFVMDQAIRSAAQLHERATASTCRSTCRRRCSTIAIWSARSASCSRRIICRLTR